MAAPEPKPSNRRAGGCDVAQDIGYALTHTTRAYQQAMNAELAPYGVTVRQSQVLGWLRKKGDLSQCQLARFLRIEPATLVGVLERMERDGLILRIVDRSDRRRKLIRLNRHAEELGDGVRAGVRQYVRVLQLLASHPQSRVQSAIEQLRGPDGADADRIIRRVERAAARERGIEHFDAWAATFGEVTGADNASMVVFDQVD